MSSSEYGLRKRASEIASQRKREECEEKQEVAMVAGAVIALGLQAAAKQELEDAFEPQPRPAGLEGILQDLKQFGKSALQVISRD